MYLTLSLQCLIVIHCCRIARTTILPTVKRVSTAPNPAQLLFLPLTRRTLFFFFPRGVTSPKLPSEIFEDNANYFGAPLIVARVSC
jgi:hypothetical protein